MSPLSPPLYEEPDDIDVPVPACENQPEELSDRELDLDVSKDHHVRVIASASSGRANGVVSDRELDLDVSKDHHIRLIAPAPPPDDDYAPLYPESDELDQDVPKVHHDRVAFRLTEEEVEKARSRKPWRVPFFCGNLSLYDTSGIESFGDRDFLIDVFLQTTFYRTRSNKKIQRSRLKPLWDSFVSNIEYRIANLEKLRREYEDSPQGFNFKLHNMCIKESVPCAVPRSCISCGLKSRKFTKSMLMHKGFEKLSEELQRMIRDVVINPAGVLIREAAAEAEVIAEVEDERIVKFVFKHMNAISKDLHSYVDNVQEKISETSDFEDSLAILKDNVEEIQQELVEDQTTQTEKMENAVRLEVFSLKQDMEVTVCDQVQVEVEKTTSAAIKRLAKTVTSVQSDLSIMKARQKNMNVQLQAAFEDITSIKSMMLSFMNAVPRPPRRSKRIAAHNR